MKLALIFAALAVASAKVVMHSTFDLEIAAKSADETKYHDFMLPLMQSMVNDQNLTSLRALHPLLNPGRDSRANGILFEFADQKAWVSFVNTYNLHFLSLSTYWRNWKSALWKSIPVDNAGPFVKRESVEGKYYYIVQFDSTPKAGQVPAYEAAVNTLFKKTIAAQKGGALVEVAHFAADGHSYATRRATFEFSSWEGVGAFLGGADYAEFSNAATGNNGFLQESVDHAAHLLTCSPCFFSRDTSLLRCSWINDESVPLPEHDDTHDGLLNPPFYSTAYSLPAPCSNIKELLMKLFLSLTSG